MNELMFNSIATSAFFYSFTNSAYTISAGYYENYGKIKTFFFQKCIKMVLLKKHDFFQI